MIKIKKYYIYLLIFISCTIYSCTGLQEAKDVLTNQKKQGKDQFLIQKKEPLTQPPDFKIIPSPNSKDKAETQAIDKIFSITEEKVNEGSSNIKSVEESIIKKIKKQ